MAYERDRIDEEKNARADLDLAPREDLDDVEDGDAESEDSGVSFLDRFFAPDRRAR